MQKTMIHINLELSGGSTWKEIKKLVDDINYLCEIKGYEIESKNISRNTKCDNTEEFITKNDYGIDLA